MSLLKHNERVTKPEIRCDDCKGTGCDAKKTENARACGQIDNDGSYIRCWTCNGNGIDPAKTFKWSNTR
jgi:hypothetical protein